MLLFKSVLFIVLFLNFFCALTDGIFASDYNHVYLLLNMQNYSMGLNAYLRLKKKLVNSTSQIFYPFLNFFSIGRFVQVSHAIIFKFFELFE
jgi:hypothetical protein